jgi:hypothetical protein
MVVKRSPRIFAMPVLIALLAFSSATDAGDWTDAGDIGLRLAVEQLVDEGVFDIPVLAWPIPDDELRTAIALAEERDMLNPAQRAALSRVRLALSPASRDWFVAGGDPTDLRSFVDAPRESGEAGVTLRWSDRERFSAQLRVTATLDPSDGQSVRMDGSYLSARTANWLWTAGWQERWWGAGREGSLQLSSNARPVFALSLDRATSRPFETPWLRWLGPWTFGTFFGALERRRPDVNDALLWGLRVAARPLPGLELSITRNAQFCGDVPPCSPRAFWDVFTGNDNVNENVLAEDEPGNQLATYEARWAGHVGRLPLGLYAQRTGETIDNKFPRPLRSLNLGQISTWGDTSGGRRWRTHVEFSSTTCADFGNARNADCGYENALFSAGYRFRGRVLGHSTDSDSRQWALGFALEDAAELWSATVRRAEINRIGFTPSTNHTLADGPQTWWVAEGRYDRPMLGGRLELALGAEHRRDDVTDETTLEPIGYLRFRRGF